LVLFSDMLCRAGCCCDRSEQEHHILRERRKDVSAKKANRAAKPSEAAKSQLAASRFQARKA